MASFSDGLMFLQMVSADGTITGQVQMLYKVRNSDQVNSENSPFTGTKKGEDISLVLTGTIANLWSGRTWTGTLRGNELNLVMPRGDGLMDTVTFRQATVSDYNKAAVGLKDNVARRAQQAQAVQQAAQAVKEQKQAVVDGNYRLEVALSRLISDTDSLAAATTYNGILESFDIIFSRMQQVDQEVRQRGAKQITCTEKTDLQVRVVDQGILLTDMRTAEVDLDVRRSDVDRSTEQLKGDISATQQAWRQLQAAVLANTTGSPPAQFTEKDLSSPSESANAQIEQSETVSSKAHAQALQRLGQAEAVHKTTKEFTDGLKCQGY